MPDNQDLKLSQEAQKAVSETASPLWKKVLLWVLGILGVLGSLVGIVALLKGKNPIAASKEVIDNTKKDIAKADLDAKIEAAKAKEKEEDVLKKLDEIKAMKNEEEALAALVKMHQEKVEKKENETAPN